MNGEKCIYLPVGWLAGRQTIVVIQIVNALLNLFGIYLFKIMNFQRLNAVTRHSCKCGAQLEAVYIQLEAAYIQLEAAYI